MEANHPNLTSLKTLYVEISRARDRAELVTDDKAALRETLEAVEPENRRGRRAGRPDWTVDGAPAARKMRLRRRSGNGHRRRNWNRPARRRAWIATWDCDRVGRMACGPSPYRANPEGRGGNARLHMSFAACCRFAAATGGFEVTRLSMDRGGSGRSGRR